MTTAWQFNHESSVWQPQGEAKFDRGLQFGDGLFETIRLTSKGRAPLFNLHKSRLKKGMSQLGFSGQAIDQVMDVFSEALILDFFNNNASCTGLKLMVTRGSTAQGYAASNDLNPNMYVQTFAAPELSVSLPLLKVGVNPIRLSRQPSLAGVKHLNRLEQVLARQQFQSDWSESLMLDTDDQLIEGTMSNVILKLGSGWVTPEIKESGIDGVVRQWLLNQADKEVCVRPVASSELRGCQSMLMINSIKGIQAVESIDGRPLMHDDVAARWHCAFLTLFS